jgi:hypothetical protein
VRLSVLNYKVVKVGRTQVTGEGQAEVKGEGRVAEIWVSGGRAHHMKSSTHRLTH